MILNNVDRRTIILFKLVGVAFFWGGTFVSGRIVAGQLPPGQAAALRFACGGACILLMLFLCRGWSAISSCDLITLFIDGISSLGASRTAQFNNLVPVFAVVLLRLVLGERLSPGGLAGGLLVITGLITTQVNSTTGVKVAREASGL